MKIIRILIKIVWSIMFLLCTAVFASIVYVNRYLPSDFQVYEGEKLSVSCALPIEADEKIDGDSLRVQAKLSEAGSKYTVDLKILGIIPAKTASVSVVEENSVMVLGSPFGIKIYSDGVMVVGMTDVDTNNGLINPAKNAGIRKGDIITLIDGLSVYSNDDIAKIIEESNGEKLCFTLIRNNKKIKIYVTPVKSKEENKYKIGLWVRDSSAGIGTFTFYNPKENMVAGLGHAICDNDTGEIIPLNYGELVEANIISVSRGRAGIAGELKGIFKNTTVGSFLLNSTTGVFGKVDESVNLRGSFMKVSNKQDVISGKAEILATIDGETPQKFDCVIEKVHFNDDSATQNMIIKITDKTLLKKTGGIVQGMSGSPIIQNGQLIGAVTHVFVNDPTRGYGIFAENMLETAQSVAEQQLKEAS